MFNFEEGVVGNGVEMLIQCFSKVSDGKGKAPEKDLNVPSSCVLHQTNSDWLLSYRGFFVIVWRK